ncbi:hypothetical protein BDZ89DRAFT_1118237 [Hymenopellis radicata]|nr:hypothetical protein BDZ89DRAFT_1118237 [Hymenopellis radicata]
MPSSPPPATPPRSSSPANGDDSDMEELSGAFAAMQSPHKRSRNNEDDELDELEGDDQSNAATGGGGGGQATVTPSPTSTGVNPNVAIIVKQYAARKKLKQEFLTEVDSFLQDSPEVQSGKFFVLLASLVTRVDDIITATPSFQISAELKKNINAYALSMILSSKVNSYKGESVTNALTAMLFRIPSLGIPATVETTPADHTLLTSAASDALTQARGTFKKILAKYMNLDIVSLGRQLTKNTKADISIPLLCRIALMRVVHSKYPGANFWDKLDRKLRRILTEAAGKPEALVRAFRFIYDEDVKKFPISGAAKIKETVDSFQEEVDTLIKATELDTAIALAAGAEAASTASAEAA